MSDRIHTSEDFKPVLLSPEGRVRRERILAEGMAAASVRARKRRLMHTTGFIGMLALCMASVWIGRTRPLSAPSGHDNSTHVVHTRQEDTRTRSAPTIDAAANTPVATDGIQRIDDAELLAMLAQTGDSYGLVAVGNRVEIVRNDR